MITLPHLKAGILLGMLVGLGKLALAAPPPEPARANPATNDPALASATASPTLAQAIEQAWQRSSQAAQARGLAALARARRLGAQAWLAGPPALELGTRTDRWHQNLGAQEHEAALALPLWLPGQRDARVGESDAELTQAGLVGHLARWQLAVDVTQAAWGVQGLQQELAALASALADLQALLADVARRVKAGELARADALAAEAETLAAAQQHLAVQARLSEALAAWQALTGWRLAPALSLPAPGSAEAHPEATAPGDHHPELQAARQRVDLAQARVASARRDTRDAPELTLGLRRERSTRDESAANTVNLALRWAWGSEARQQPLLQAALAEEDEARTALTLAESRLQAQAALADAQARSSLAQLQAAQSRAGVLSQRAALIDRAFRAGDIALPELLRARNEQRRAQAELAAQEAATGQSLARRQHLQGSQP